MVVPTCPRPRHHQRAVSPPRSPLTGAKWRTSVRYCGATMRVRSLDDSCVGRVPSGMTSTAISPRSRRRGAGSYRAFRPGPIAADEYFPLGDLLQRVRKGGPAAVASAEVRRGNVAMHQVGEMLGCEASPIAPLRHVEQGRDWGRLTPK